MEKQITGVLLRLLQQRLLQLVVLTNDNLMGQAPRGVLALEIVLTKEVMHHTITRSGAQTGRMLISGQMFPP